MSSRYTGMDGENTACDYLTGMGAKILDRNVRLAGGEIDIIACQEGTYLLSRSSAAPPANTALPLPPSLPPRPGGFSGRLPCIWPCTA